MLHIYTRYSEIHPQAWDALAERSAWTTWFQTRAAYDFYSRMQQEIPPSKQKRQSAGMYSANIYHTQADY